MLRIHRGERADVLADVLADRLSVPLSDPFTPEVVTVSEPGVQRWLRQRMARRLGTADGDGIAANIAFDSPQWVLDRIVDTVADDPQAGALWFDDRLRWPVLRVLDAEIDRPELAVVAEHLGRGERGHTADRRRARRLSAASTIATLFRRYGRYRPSMIADWAAGHDTDGSGAALADHFLWQPWLWRRVRDEIGHPHLAEGLPSLTARLRDDPDAVDLPARLGVFGTTGAHETFRTVMGALAEHRDVEIYLPHPSPALWGQVASRSRLPHPARRSARPPIRPTNRLLGALSHEIQERQEVLSPSADEVICHPGPDPGSGLLGRVQAGLRADARDTAPTGARAQPDGTLEVHACHGPQRQVEVLRDRLLRLFADHPDLEPRDVLVLCPDVDRFAPLIRGAFAQPGLDHPAYSVRVRLADRGAREQNAVLDVVGRVLELGAGRVRAGDLIDLAAAEPVRRRFEFTDDDIDTIAGWVRRAGIRWGVDQTQRSRFGLAGFPQGTVAAGLDRILLGVVAEESTHEWLATALPLSGIDSTDTDLAGRLAEFVQRLTTILHETTRTASAAQWRDILLGAVDALTAVDSDTEWQRAQCVAMVTEALTTPGDQSAPPLDPADVRDLVDALMSRRPTRANYCTGDLTVTSMAPMRSVPHRAVVVIGMDADAYPRSPAVDGDDILSAIPLVGERSPRDEDRQLFLDAICAATDHLLVFYTGADPLTGAELPPAAVVADLVEATRELLELPPGATSPIVHRHSLHAFDERNFVGDRPVSFDSTLLPAARALSSLNRSGRRGDRLPVIADEALPPVDTAADVELDELIAFVTAPIEAFARQRLGVGIPDPPDEHRDELAVDLDGLERWGVGDRFLRALLTGDDPAAARGAELRRGTLPPFGFGTRLLATLSEKAEAIALAGSGHRGSAPDAIDVRVPLAGGRRIHGTVGEVFDGRLVPVSYSRLGVKHRIGAWIRLLAVAAGSDAEVREAIVIGGAGGRDAAAQISRLTVPDDARDHLATLVAIRDLGLAAPMGLTLDAGAAAAQDFGRGGRPDRALRRAESRYGYSYGDRNRYAGLVFHGDADAAVSFDTLRQAVPTAQVARDAGIDVPGDGSGSVYVGLAAAVFGPMLQMERDR